jgi:hypothetical protein
VQRIRVIPVMTAVAVVACLVAVAAPAAGAKTVWLCLPGHAPDPCAPGLSTTVYSPKIKKLGVQHPQRVKSPAIDCFYVYPTVSGQPTGNSNLVIGPAERSVALYQAARYSQYCKVYAPMYRQVTLVALGTTPVKPTTPPNPVLSLADVRAAFTAYLKNYNHGRGFVLIGHSQGSAVLRELIALDIDPKPAVCKHLVSAILMGGNVLVKKGSDVGGDFKHIPGCHSASQLGCVIAFSTFDQPVPPDSLFGRPTALPGTPPPPKGTVVLCTNPAALAGGSGPLTPIFPTAPFYKGSSLYAANLALKLKTPHPHTEWWTEPDAYSARCSSADGANVLEITPLGGAVRPSPSPTPAWGLHLIDANIALGNLITIVDKEAAVYVAHGGK